MLRLFLTVHTLVRSSGIFRRNLCFDYSLWLFELIHEMSYLLNKIFKDPCNYMRIHKFKACMFLEQLLIRFFNLLNTNPLCYYLSSLASIACCLVLEYFRDLLKYILQNKF